MTELQLYKFITGNSIETGKDRNDDTLVFIEHYRLGDWCELLGAGIFDEDGLPCICKDKYTCWNMRDICYYFGIEMKNIFTNG